MKREKETIVKNDAPALLADESIVELYWQRNEKAISETDRKYGKYLYVIAYNIVHDRLDCEECLNDTYLGTWNQIPPQRPNVFQVFLSRIMRNIAVDRLRANSAQKRVPSEMMVSLDELNDCITDEVTMEETIALRELSRVMNDYLRTLNDREQFIFVCRYYIEEGITAVASEAFQGLTNLTNITLSNTIETIGNNAFGDCSALTDVYFKGTEEEWNAINFGSGNTCLTSATIHFLPE